MLIIFKELLTPKCDGKMLFEIKWNTSKKAHRKKFLKGAVLVISFNTLFMIDESIHGVHGGNFLIYLFFFLKKKKKDQLNTLEMKKKSQQLITSFENITRHFERMEKLCDRILMQRNILIL